MATPPPMADRASMGRYGIGKQLLERWGWAEGLGLGKNNEGMAEPIIPRVKNNRLGVDYHRQEQQNEYEDVRRERDDEEEKESGEDSEENQDQHIRRKRKFGGGYQDDAATRSSPTSSRTRRWQDNDQVVDVDALRREYVTGPKKEDDKLYPLLAIVMDSKKEVQRKMLVRESRMKRTIGATLARGLERKEENRQIYQNLIKFRDHLKTDEDQGDHSKKDPTMMTVKELKEVLEKKGVGHSHCVEKEELVALVVEHGGIDEPVAELKKKEKDEDNEGVKEKRRKVAQMVDILLVAFEGERIEEEVEELIVEDEEEEEQEEEKEAKNENAEVIDLTDEQGEEKVGNDDEEVVEGEEEEAEEEGAGEQGAEGQDGMEGEAGSTAMEIDLTEEAVAQMQVEEDDNKGEEADAHTREEEGEEEEEEEEGEEEELLLPTRTRTVMRTRVRWQNKLPIGQLLNVLPMLQQQYGDEYEEYQLHWVVLFFLVTRFKKVMKERWAEVWRRSLGEILRKESVEVSSGSSEKERERKVGYLVKRLKLLLMPWKRLLHSAEHTYIHPTHVRRRDDTQQQTKRRRRGGGLFRGRGAGYSVFAVMEEEEEDKEEGRGGEKEEGGFFSFTEEGAAYYTFLHLFVMPKEVEAVRENWMDGTRCDYVLLYLNELKRREEKREKREKGKEREKVEKGERKKKRIGAMGIAARRRRLIPEVCLPKLKQEIDEWTFLRNDEDEEEGDGNDVSATNHRRLQPHIWLHPWLPVWMEENRWMDDMLRHFLDRIEALIPLWHPADPSLLSVLLPWSAMLHLPDYRGFLEKLSSQFLVPRFEAILLEDLSFDLLSPERNEMPSQSLVRRIFDWTRMVSPEIILLVLRKGFFPRWVNHLQRCLQSGSESDPLMMEKAARWYTEWKAFLRRLSPALVRRKEICEELNKALMVMQKAALAIVKETTAGGGISQGL